MLTALTDPNKYVRAVAIEALGEIGDPAVIPYLVKLLSDVEQPLLMPRICDISAAALECIGTPEALAAIAAWQRGEQDASE